MAAGSCPATNQRSWKDRSGAIAGSISSQELPRQLNRRCSISYLSSILGPPQYGAVPRREPTAEAEHEVEVRGRHDGDTSRYLVVGRPASGRVTVWDSHDVAVINCRQATYAPRGLEQTGPCVRGIDAVRVAGETSRSTKVVTTMAIMVWVWYEKTGRPMGRWRPASRRLSATHLLCQRGMFWGYDRV